MKIIVQTTGGDDSYLNGKRESPTFRRVDGHFTWIHVFLLLDELKFL